jgi:hypothetical protein
MEGQLVVHMMRAELTVARAFGEQLIVLGEQLGDTTGTANTHVVLSATLYNLGEVELAHAHAERGRAMFDPALPPLPADVGILSALMLASTYGYRGFVGPAQSWRREALTRAIDLGTPFHRAFGLNLVAQLGMLFDDPVPARPLAQEALQLAREYDFDALRSTAAIVHGWCEVMAGRVDDGLTTLRTAFHDYEASGQRFGKTIYSSVLARSYLAAGDIPSAQAVADAALRFVAETGERLYEAEFYRLHGECLLVGRPTRSQKADAISHFERAMAVAGERKGSCTRCALRPVSLASSDQRADAWPNLSTASPRRTIVQTCGPHAPLSVCRATSII